MPQPVKTVISPAPSEGSKPARRLGARAERWPLVPAKYTSRKLKTGTQISQHASGTIRLTTKGPTQLHLGPRGRASERRSERESERAVPAAAQCPCRHPTNTLSIVSAACSQLCKHPPSPPAPPMLYSDPEQEVISCATSVAAFLSQVAGPSRQPSRTKGERWRTEGVAGPGRPRGPSALC